MIILQGGLQVQKSPPFVHVLRDEDFFLYCATEDAAKDMFALAVRLIKLEGKESDAGTKAKVKA